MKPLLRVTALSLVLFLVPGSSRPEKSTSLLRFPDVHGDRVVFSCSGDLWIAPLAGGTALRLTSGEGAEYFPKFSPDGRWIAFTGQYKGYSDVYVLPASGGVPRQLTFYPSRANYDNQVLDWTPDGEHVVFRSLRDSTGKAGRFFRIRREGGWPEALPLLEGGTLSFSPDGKKMAFTRENRDFEAWKRYTGGQAQEIWTYDFEKDQIEKITDWEGTDHQPMWHGDRIYFVSDRTGKLNLHRWDTRTRETTRVTDYQDWDVKWPAYGPEAMVFERGGRLYRMSFADEKVAPIAIALNQAPAARYVRVTKNLESGALSPDGNAVAFAARGEIFVGPANQPSPRNLTATPGARERDVAWSPDGSLLAFISDESGSEELWVFNPQGKERRQLSRESGWAIRRPVWSPDSKRIAFYDLDMNLYYVEVATGKKIKVDDSRQTYIESYCWSPDSRWLAYTKLDRVDSASIFLYSLEGRKVHRVTDERTHDPEVGFDPQGRYLFFISSRDLSPVHTQIEYNFGFNDMDRVYLGTLRSDTPSPFLPEGEPNPDESKKAPGIEIALEGLGERVVPLPIPPGTLSGLRVGNDVVFYYRRKELDPGSPRALYAYDLKAKKEVKIVEDPLYFELSADGSKLLLGTPETYRVLNAKAESIDAQAAAQWTRLELEMWHEPIPEWRQIFREAWRWQKNLHFYRDEKGLLTPRGAPVDWPGLLDRYLPLVDNLTDRRDLNYLMAELIGELEIGHLGAFGGDIPEVENARTGLLGALLEPEPSGYFRIARILKGENWNADTRSPLTEPGVKARVGDYLLEINGRPLRLPQSPYELLEKTLGATVTLKLNTSPGPGGAWTVRIQPIASESSLRYLDWVEVNRQKVLKATNGRVGYIHLPNHSTLGLIRFASMWFSQLDKEGIIVDQRSNGGGFVAEEILERIRRFPVGMNKCRSCGTWTYPKAAFAGHTVMLTDKYAGSDGDNFPYFYRKYNLGPIVGTRTWGGVVGGGALMLADGGRVTAADNAVTNLALDPEVENYGVEPDVAVDNLPNEAAQGRDAQLEKAIEVILDRIAKSPVKLAPVPPTP